MNALARSLGATAALVAACSAYASSSPPADGALGGACFPNRTCDTTLECIDGTCTAPGTPSGEAGSDATEDGRDASSSFDANDPDGSTDDSGDAADCNVAPNPAPPLACGGTTCSTPTTICCGSPAACVDRSQPSCQSIFNHYECYADAHCGSSTPICCGQISATSSPACPPKVVLSGSVCTADATCGSLRHLCDPDSLSCVAGQSCRGVQLVISAESLVLAGACL